jgi:hypothetical protein
VAKTHCSDITWSTDSIWFQIADTPTHPYLFRCIGCLHKLIAISPDHKLPKDAVIDSLRPVFEAFSADKSIPAQNTLLGLSLIAHIQPQLFNPVFCERLGQMMQRLVATPNQWLTAHHFFRVVRILRMIVVVMFHHRHSSMANNFHLILEPAIASETFLRQCADNDFRQSFSLIPVLGYLMTIRPNWTLEVLTRYHDKKVFPLSSKDSVANGRLLQMQGQILQELHHATRNVKEMVLFQMSPNQPSITWQLPAPDMTITVLGLRDKAGVFECHRAILCDKSSYFRTGMQGPFAESESNSVRLRDLDAWAVSIVLQSIYAMSTSWSLVIHEINHGDYTRRSLSVMLLHQKLTLSLSQTMFVMHTANYLGVVDLVDQLRILLITSDRFPDIIAWIQKHIDLYVHEDVLEACHLYLLSHGYTQEPQEFVTQSVDQLHTLTLLT